MGDFEQFTIKAAGQLSAIDADEWQACAGPDNVFASYAFLSALEDSGSASPESGWAPAHLLVEDREGRLAGVMPAYVKSHSYGEYVFDHAWAAAYERAGGVYYPKLQASIPFTPATGRRLLVRAGADTDLIEDRLMNGAVALAQDLEVSSLHITFCTRPEWDHLGRGGFLQRTDQQFHWLNKDYESFDDFLAALSSRKRKTIRRERRGALENGIEIETVTGSDLREAHWDAFYEFYVDTGARKWGQPYLNREFFSLLGERLAQNVVLFLCRRDGRYIAGALNLIGGGTLFGRYWGCMEQHKFLHFETCYYRAIDFAIETGLDRVEAGAQGGHKLLRGYEPCKTYSAHWIADPGFRDAVARYLEHERLEVDAEIDFLAARMPFKKKG